MGWFMIAIYYIFRAAAQLSYLSHQTNTYVGECARNLSTHINNRFSTKIVGATYFKILIFGFLAPILIAYISAFNNYG